MPEPRRLRELDSHLPAISLQSQATRQAEAARRRRSGTAGRVPVEIRNGLPFKPYVYRGHRLRPDGGARCLS